MKTIIICLAMLFAASTYAGPATHESIVKKFNATFPEAQSIKWYNSAGYYEVSFINKNIPERVYYDQDGKVFRTIRYYDESKLNPFLLQKIEEKYRNKTIKSITELQEDSGILYQIILQDKKHLYVVNCNGSGEMYVQHKYIKG
ncbi:MAG TPA: hypothetical protein VLI68_12640 [Hanamia sp.]|jgi:hypothetical protein|nr:hypothetical protein [Hanamia sp.]